MTKRSSDLKIVWHSCASWAPSGYGQQTAIWMQQLVKMGHEVICSTYWGLSGSPTSWNGITVLPGFGGNYCTTSLHQHCQRINPDLVITLGDVWVMDPNLLRELPLAHWLPSDCRPMSTADRVNVEASGAQLIAMSRFGYDRFKEAGFDPVYVPHGIDMNVFSPPEDRAQVRKEMGVAEDDFVIGINGANNDAIRKALPEQMLAFAKFAKDHPDALLALHTGVHQDGGQDLEALAENLGITDRVRCVDQYRYHAGLVQPGDLADWYGMLDVLSATAFGEGFGIPIIEAQACGTPVITTDASSMPELNPLGISVGGEPFWNGVHKGWWVKPSVGEIVAAYEQAYANRDVPRDELREFAGEYSVENVAERHMKPAVDELLARMEARKV
jgi:glycosyltransferase involved in cell wall biosynthesis